MTGADPWIRETNSGGPSSRSRSVRLATTVLGLGAGPIRCPRVLRVGLDFGNADPLAFIRDLLRNCGFDDETEAREAVALPPAPCICRPDALERPTPITALEPDELLYQALVLGLCTPWRYDPGRPVLWTRTSLTRRLELFSGQEFYA